MDARLGNNPAKRDGRDGGHAGRLDAGAARWADTALGGWRVGVHRVAGGLDRRGQRRLLRRPPHPLDRNGVGRGAA
jgi:hypothetical protein